VFGVIQNIGDKLETSHKQKVAIILPALNEELTVSDTVSGFNKHAPGAEIWVIDNGSDDNTLEAAKHALLKIGAKGGVLSETRRGKGNAIRRAFREIDADIYVMADADLTYPASSVQSLIRPIIEGEAEMVVGDRISNGSYRSSKNRAFHGFGNGLVSALVNLLYQSNLKDVMSGYRALNRQFVKTYPILVNGFQIEADLTLHALDKRLKIIEIPIQYLDRPQGSESKLSTFSDGTRVLRTIGRIFRLYKPFALFGVLALALLGVSLGIGAPVINEWLATGLVPRLPTALFAATFGIFSLIFFTIAVVLDSLAQNEKRAFEMTLLGYRYP
jgi:glycosyltransferase involved in cell wall biosynthesis